MKNWKIFFLCAALLGVTAVSCSDSDEPTVPVQSEDENNGNGGGNGGNDDNDRPTLSDVTVEAFYGGDYNEAGTGNLWLNISQGDFSIEYDDFDEITGYVGNGSVVTIDLNQALAANPDQVSLAAGTYSVDLTESFAEGTVNGTESYVMRVVDGQVSQQAFVSGSVTITDHGEKIYTVACDLTTSEGEAFTESYTILCRPFNRSGEGIMSNLDKDVEVDDLTQALFLYEGDLYETGESDLYIVILGADDFDLNTNYGLGNSLMLYFNVEPGSSTGIPSGTYDQFVDIETAESLPVGSCLTGLYYYGTYLGCWYMNTGNQYEARLCEGAIEVENNGGSYTIRGELKTGDDRTVAFTYAGTPTFVDDASASFSVKKHSVRPLKR